MKKEEIRKTCSMVLLMMCLAFLASIPCLAGIQNNSQDLYIEVNDGKISLDITNQPLIDVLLSVQARTGIEIKMVGIIRDRVSIKFSDLSLEQALNRLLRRVGYAALWEEKDDNSTLKRLWICEEAEGFKIDKLRTNISENFRHKVYTKNTRNEKPKESIDKGTPSVNKDIGPRVKSHISSYRTSYHNIDNSSRLVNNYLSSYDMAGHNDIESKNDSDDSLIYNSNNLTRVVAVENGKGVGAYEFRITYDPKLVQVENITPGSYLSDTGRNVSVLGPRIDNKKGEASFGVFSFGDEEGACDEGVLAKITYSGSSKASLKLIKVQITDTKANKLSLIPRIQ